MGTTIKEAQRNDLIEIINNTRRILEQAELQLAVLDAEMQEAKKE